MIDECTTTAVQDRLNVLVEKKNPFSDYTYLAIPTYTYRRRRVYTRDKRF